MVTFGKTFAKVKLNKGQIHRREKFAEKLSIHGLPLALKSKTWTGRIFWAILFFTALGWLLVQLTRLYGNISRSPTAINLQKKRTKNMVLPELTVCSPQSFNVSKLYDDGLNLDITSYMSSTLQSINNSSFKATTEFSTEQLETKKAEIFLHAGYRSFPKIRPGRIFGK